MAGFRDHFISRVNAIAGKLPANLLLKLTGTRSILPFYHAISNEDLPHIKHLYSVKNAVQFERDLDYLLTYFQPIDYSEFLEQKSQHIVLQKPTFLLSFDDGLKEFYEVVAPILLRKGIPAMCFVNSAFVDNQALFYRYKASLLISEFTQHPHKLKLLDTALSNPSKWESELLSVNYQNRDILDNIAQTIEFNFQDFLQTQQPYLTSDQIKTLIKQGFAFGGHSVDHPVFHRISLEEQFEQTHESVDFVATKFGLNYKIFSFPFTDYGVSKAFFNKVIEENMVDATFGSAGLKKDQAKFNYQRIALEMEDFSAQQIIQSELLYNLVRMPFGKNVISRSDKV